MASGVDNKHKNLWEVNEVLRSVIQEMPVGIIIIDLYGVVKLWNKGAENIFGWTEEEVKGGMYHLIAGIGESKYRRAFRRVAQTRKTVTYSETKRRRKDGSDVTVCINVVPFIDEDHVVQGIILMVEDLTVRKDSEKVLKETMNELENMKYSLDESSLLTITDPRGVITYTNDRFCELFQYEREELVGFDHRVINSGYHPKEFFKNMWNTLGNGKIFRGEIRNKAKDGTIIWVDGTIVPFVNEDGRPYQFMSICNDITDKKRAEEELMYLAYHDELTGLANRRKMKDVAEDDIRNERSFALLCLDIDRFRFINDSYGFTVGDSVLVEVADRLRSILPDTSVIARKDRDKFLILVRNGDLEEVRHLCHQLLFEIPRPFDINNNRIYTTISIGVCHFPKDGQHFDDLLKKSVHAMCAAKREKKNYFLMFDEELERETNRRIELEQRLRGALNNNELSIHYQPRIDSFTKKIAGMEALLRWNPPGLGPVTPAEFIPIAEETGLIIPIGKWIFENALKQTKEWHEKGYSSLKISINLSPIQLIEPDIDDYIISTVKEMNYPPERLELEITENTELENNVVLQQKLRKLQNVGIQISIDDFGTGYSSLSYLRDFPINRLKIDRSFLQDIRKDGDSPIVRTIIAMAKSLGFHVTAEGIEDEEQIKYLQEHGCDELQGFYFSRPVAAPEFLTILQDV